VRPEPSAGPTVSGPEADLAGREATLP